MNLISEVSWIECSKSLPKNDDIALIFNSKWENKVEVGSYSDEVWITNDGLELDDIGSNISPSHWANLPKGPNLI